MDHFNIHFTPFFFVIAGVLKLWEHLLFFVSLHGLALSIASVGLYKFSSKITQSRILGLIPVFFFMFNTFTQRTIMYVHFEVFSLPFLFWFAYFAVSGMRWQALVCLLFALSVKQDVWIYAIAMACTLIGVISRKDLVLYMSISLGYFFLVLNIVYPWFYPSPYDRFLDFWNYGHSKREVLVYLLKHPESVIQKILSVRGDAFQRSFWYLPIAAGLRYIPALGVLALWMSSSELKVYGFYFYYSLPSLLMYSICFSFAIVNIRKFVMYSFDLFKERPFIKSLSFTKPQVHTVSVALVALILVGTYEWSPYFRLNVRKRASEILHVLNHHDRLKQDSLIVSTSANLSAYIKPIRNSMPFYYQKEQFFKGVFKPDLVLYDLEGEDDGSVSQEDKKKLEAYLKTSFEYEEVQTGVEGLLFYALR